MNKNQEKTFKDYVESLCCSSEDIAMSSDGNIDFFHKLVEERRALKQKFYKWFKNNCK